MPIIRPALIPQHAGPDELPADDPPSLDTVIA